MAEIDDLGGGWQPPSEPPPETTDAEDWWSRHATEWTPPPPPQAQPAETPQERRQREREEGIYPQPPPIAAPRARPPGNWWDDIASRIGEIARQAALINPYTGSPYQHGYSVPTLGFTAPSGFGAVAPAPESRYIVPVHSEYVYQYNVAKQTAMDDAIRQLTERKRAETGDPNAALDPDELARIEEQARHFARRAADVQYGGGAVTAPPRGITAGGGRDMGSLAFALNAHQISEPDAYRAAWAGGFRGKTGDFGKDYNDFLVEKDRIIHQSGVNRGGEGFYAPPANPLTRTPFLGYSFRPLTRRRILI